MGLNDLKTRIRREIRILTIAVLLLACSLTIVPVLAILFLIYRRCVVLFASWFRPDLHKPLRGLSNICAIDDVETRPKINTVAMLKTDAPVKLELARSLFQDRIINLTKPDGELKYPELRQRWVSFLGYYFWKWDKNFDIKTHVREYDYNGELTVPTPCTDEDLRKVMGGLLAKPWKKDQSAWEALFVKSYDPDSSSGYTTTIILRIHHTYGDAYSFLKLFIQDLAAMKDGMLKAKFPETSFCNKICTAISLPFAVPYQIAEEVVNGANGYNAWHLTDTKLSREYHTAMSRSIPVETIKQIRKKHGVNYNAVLCAGLAGGIRKVMQAAGQEVPASISCLIPIPLPSHPGGLVVHAASIFTKIPLLAKTPAECLWHINETMKKSKVPAHIYAQVCFMKYIGIAPIFHNRFLRTQISSTIALSCFPGPENPPPLLGANLTDVLAGCGLGAGKTGAFAVLCSYNGRQRFSVNIDKTVFPSEKIFAKLGSFIEDEMQIMLKEHVHEPLNVVRNRKWDDIV